MLVKMSNISILFFQITKMSRLKKQLIVLIFDVLISFFSLYLAFAIRLETFNISFSINFFVLILFCLFFIPFFISLGLYKAIFRYSGLYSILYIVLACSIYGIIFFILVFFFKLNEVPRSIGVLQPILFLIVVCFLRVLIVTLDIFLKKTTDRKNILLYGAGTLGYHAINLLRQHNVIGFIDDDNKKIGHIINNYKIYAIESVSDLIKKKNINQIIITITNLSLLNRKKIISNINNFNIEILFFPSTEQIVDKKIEFNKFERVDLIDIIDRKIKWNLDTIFNFINNKTILITGAGGSIGSELVIQIINNKPKKLVLIDNNEFNLYSIEQRIHNLKLELLDNIHIIYSLTSINDKKLLSVIFNDHKPQIVFHAAAYKHVPIAEKNISSCVYNNVIGTSNLIDLSINLRVQNFLFVSTDKAVRPTNIMGASKRISELNLISKSKKNKNNSTNISIVRFGNVIGSTGSVIPLFKNQLIKGGPITVTHPEVTRYFMSVREAVGLILETLIISNGGEVFVLDMGKPIKILDLAKKIIHLYGYKEKTLENQKNGIEIKYIGLRPGEKLYEELLIGKNPVMTSNKNIFLEKEQIIESEMMNKILLELEEYILSNNESAIIDLLEKNIINYKFKKN